MVHPWRHRRLLLALALAASTVVATSLAHRPTITHASGYACDSHCYGIVQWDNGGSGASTQILVTSLSPGDGFVTNEMWFNGEPGPGSICTAQGIDTGCWVEAGVTVGSVKDTYCATDCYYWADVRPCNGCSDNYNEHFMGYPPAGDMGQRTTFQIVANPPCGACGWSGDCPNSEFGVTVTGASGAVFSGLSFANGMIPSNIQLGMELYGTNGAAASPGQYAFNQYRAPTTGLYYYQTTDGHSHTPDSPVLAHWQFPPSSNTYPGGVWTTSCPIGGC